MLRCLRRGGLAVLLVVIVAGTARAQLAIDIQFPHKNFLLYEPIQATLVVQNGMGSAVILRPGGELYQAEVEVRDYRNNIMARTEQPLITDLHTINPMQQGRISVNLLQSHRIREPGTYRVTASIKYQGQTFVSPKYFIDVAEGHILKQLQTFEPPRRFTLRLSNRNFVDTLLLRVDDLRNETHYGVYVLGRMLRNFEPQAALENGSVVHVVHRLTPRQYMHSTFSAGGVPLNQQVLNSSTAQGPVLEMGPDGNVVVSGAQAEALGRESMDLTDIGIGIPSSAPAGRRAPPAPAP